MAKIVQRKIKWGVSTSSDVVSHKVYWSPESVPVSYTSESREFAMPKTEAIVPTDIPELDAIDSVLNIGVTAVDDVGNESDLRVVNGVPFDFLAPLAPTSLVVEAL